MTNELKSSTRINTLNNVGFGSFNKKNFVKTVVFHHIDMDGYSSADIVKTALQKVVDSLDTDKTYDDLISFVPYNYEKDVDLTSYVEPGSNVITVDLSLKVDQFKQLMDVANEIFVMDHHISTLRIFDELSLSGDYFALHGVDNIFFDIDTERCGTKIAYDTFKAYAEMFGTDTINPKIIDLIDKFDRWVDTSVSIYLNTYYQSSNRMNLFDGFVHKTLCSSDDTLDEILQIGKEIFDIDQQKMAILKTAFGYPFTSSQGYSVYTMFGSGNSTMFGNYIDIYDIVARVRYNKNGTATISIYTNKDIDLSTIAESHGGGGHKKAAGFTIDLSEITDDKRLF